MLTSTGTCTLILFFFNHTATPAIYTLSLHDALPISAATERRLRTAALIGIRTERKASRSTRMLSSTTTAIIDRKSTRLNSSHPSISYAVFCLKKKKKKYEQTKQKHHQKDG